MLGRLVRQNNLKISSLVYEILIIKKYLDEESCLLNYLKISTKICYGLIIIQIRELIYVIFNKKIKKIQSRLAQKFIKKK